MYTNKVKAAPVSAEGEQLTQTLIRAMINGLSIIIAPENGQTKITVYNKHTKKTNSQYLPIDAHLRPEKLSDCLRFCINKTT